MFFFLLPTQYDYGTGEKSENTETILPQNIRVKRIIAYLCKHFGREGEGLCLSKVRVKPVLQKRETNSIVPKRINRDIPL